MTKTLRGIAPHDETPTTYVFDLFTWHSGEVKASIAVTQDMIADYRRDFPVHSKVEANVTIALRIYHEALRATLLLALRKTGVDTSMLFLRYFTEGGL